MNKTDGDIEDRAGDRAQICRGLIAERKRVGVHLGFDLCPAPVWDILLDLFLAEQADRPVQIWSLCVAANVPSSTAHRKISDMINRGLLVRSLTGSRVMVRLAPTTVLSLEALFDDLARAK
jgi:uncharacterized membrane-anchored protein